MSSDRGLLIVFEGLDQSGKQTQAERLRDRLVAAGHTVRLLSFPDYDTAIGKEIGLALRGERDFPADVMQLLYVANRHEYKERIVRDLAAGVMVVCDRLQVLSAVSNLIDNAVKYSNRGGVVRLSAVIDDTNLIVEVADQGIGIPQRDLDRIFERFYRVDRARSRETGGTGLGLAIVRHVATNHGGTVSVRSREGEGSVFSLSIPLEGC